MESDIYVKVYKKHTLLVTTLSPGVECLINLC